MTVMCSHIINCVHIRCCFDIIVDGLEGIRDHFGVTKMYNTSNSLLENEFHVV